MQLPGGDSFSVHYANYSNDYLTNTEISPTDTQDAHQTNIFHQHLCYTQYFSQCKEQNVTTKGKHMMQ